MGRAGRDPSNVPTLIALDSTLGTSIVRLWADSTTHRLLTESLAVSATDMEGGGKISVGTSAVEMTFTGTTKSIILTADKDNTGLIFIGKSNVTNAGANAIAPLNASEALIIEFDDSSNGVYAVSDTASQNVWKGALI